MRLRVVAWVVGGGLASLLLGSLGWGLVNASNKLPSSLVGRASPEMTIAALDGRQLKLSSFHGTPLVVNFWASWCLPCKDEAPVLNAAARAYDGRVQFIGVAIQDSDSAARAFQADVVSPYPVGPAIKGSFHEWGVMAPPETFFIDRQGVVVSKVMGSVDRQRLELYLSQLRP